MPIYMSYGSVRGDLGGAGQGQVLGMSLGSTVLTPSNVVQVIRGSQSQSHGQSHELLLVLQTVDGSSSMPQAARAGLITGRVAPSSLQIQFKVASGQGSSKPYFTITLTGATLVGIETRRNSRLSGSGGKGEIERIKLTFQKIEIEWNGGGVSASDDWTQ